MIAVTGLRKAFGARVLFDGADLRVGARDRVALVGPNGSGKTTLLEVIAGLQDPDAGRVEIPGGVAIGYLAQETDALRGRSVLEEVVGAAAAMTQVGHRLAVLERELGSVDGPAREQVLAEYSRLIERFDSLGGYTLETRAQRILAGLGFGPDDGARATDSLSGGWLMRVALAKLLIATPDLLLLDEPTNHLDLSSVVWLERFLRSYEGAVVAVGHDRDFLNGIATRVVEIERANLVSYTGDFESFVRQRALRAEQAESAARNLARTRAHTKVFIERFRYKASRARQVQSRIKMLERMDPAPAAPERRRAMRLGFPPPPRAGRVVGELAGVGFAYGERRVYDGLDLVIERGDKAALVGPNGAGKTTLLKLLAGVLDPDAGERRFGHKVAVGYFAQHQIEALDPRNRVIEELQRAIPSGAEVRARDLLGRFLFSGGDVDKPVSVLSGGERSRLALAKMLVSPVNLLCLDEPTNHLDIPARDVLEDALEAYAGTLVLITHDRHLIRSVAGRIVEVVEGRVRSFACGYEEYLERRAAEDAVLAAPDGRGLAPSRAASARRAAARERDGSARARAALSRVERELDEVHAGMEALGVRLADPALYASGEGVAETVRDYRRAERRVADLEREWDRLTAELSG